MNSRPILIGAGFLLACLAGIAIYLGVIRKDPKPDVSKPDPPAPERSHVASSSPVFAPVPISLAIAAEHIYQGKDAKQVGVKENAIVAYRAAVLKGRVLTREGQPLVGVKIHVARHPEIGSTQSQADGTFNLVVNGGGFLCIHYQKEGYLPLCRFINAPWQDHAWLPDVALIPVDSQVTPIDLKSPTAIQIARGSVVKDKDGERQATVFIPQGTKAQMILPDKSLKALDSIKVRISEYTVGPNGPAAMPAALPPTSAYTYAFELSADEVMAGGIKVAGKDLILSQPLVVFVENFLKFPVGTPMPMGYFDNDKAAWIASDNGLVIQLLPPKGELSEIDIDGTGTAANAATLKKLGVSDAERKQLASLYKPGQSLWRVKVNHFSTHDANQAPGDAQSPDGPGSEGGRRRPCNEETEGSVIDIHNQILGEEIDLVGVPFRLHYRSHLAAGHAASRTARIPLSGPNIPKSLKRIDLEVLIAGQKHTKTFPPAANLTHTFTWDGKNDQGQPLAGAQTATVRIGWVFDPVYQVPERFGEPPVRPTPVRSRQELTYWRDEQITIGSFDSRGFGLGGCSLSIHHAYDPVGRMLYLGHGKVLGGAGGGAKQSINQGIETVVGGASNFALGNGGPAVQARIDDLRPNRGAGMARDRFVRYPRGLAVGPDGSLYLSDANDQIRKVTPDGVIQTIAGGGKTTPKAGLKAVEAEFAYRSAGSLALGADGSVYVVEITGQRVWRIGLDGNLSVVAGSGSYGYGGDGGPASEAKLAYPAAIAVAADGTVYIADTDNHRIRRVGPDGKISTLAGAGTKGYSGDGGPARQAKFYSPTGLALAADGTLYIADTGNYVIRRLTPGGGLSTVAGLHREDWTHEFGGDGGPALKAQFDEPSGIALGPDGALYIADTDNHRIRRVGLDGTVSTVAGSTVEDAKKGDFRGDGGPATEAKLSFPSAVAFGPDGGLYVYDGYLRSEITKLQQRIRRIAPAMPGFNNREIVIPSENGRELFKFSAAGQHLETVNALTLKSIYRFEYDKNRQLIAIADAFQNTTTIERDTAGHPLALVAPYGQRTGFTLDANGYLAKVTNPAGEYVEMNYQSGGLLVSFRNPRGHITRFHYDELGRLTKDEDPLGGFTALARTESARGFEVALTTALKPATTYTVNDLANGSEDRLEKCCCGAETKTSLSEGRGYEVRHPDGTVEIVTLQPDPRWGLHNPLLKSFTMTTPGGRKQETTFARKAHLNQPNNPLSLKSFVDTTTVNGQISTSTLDLTSKTVVSVSPAGRMRTTMFDDHGRMIRSEHPGFAPAAVEYDAKGRVVAVRQGEGAEQRLVRFEYDSTGNVSTITDPLKRTVRLEYDKAGRLTKQTLPDRRDIAFEFDPDGNLKSLTPPGKPAHTFEYTALNQTTKYTPPESGPGQSAIEYEFNKDRKLTKVTRPDGKIVSLAYSKVGLLESVTLPGQEHRFTFDPKTEQLRKITDAESSLAFEYDGLLPTVTTWDGPIRGSVKREYDNHFRMSSVSVNGGPATEFQYDADGLLTQTGALKIQRDPKTGFIRETTLGTVSTAMDYSGFGERKKFVAKVGGKDIMAIEYERDAVGRILKKTETIEGKTDVYTYEYDTAGRLKVASVNGKVVGQYEYDSNGNRVKYEGQRGLFAGRYDARDRIQSYGDSTFKHNANGELESVTKAGKTTAIKLDPLGNLRAVVLPDGPKIEYVVDAVNRRIGKKVDGKLVQGFLWQGRLKPVAELNGEGNLVTRFEYGTNVNVPESMEKGGQTYRLVTDHLGSVRFVIDVATGKAVQRMDYDEFGNILSDSNPGFQPFGFAGGLYDHQTKLVRYGVRDFDATTGLWNQPDSIRFRGGQANLFSYVDNDPVNAIDPAGYQSSGSGSTGNHLDPIPVPTSNPPRFDDYTWCPKPREPWYKRYKDMFNGLGNRYDQGWTLFDEEDELARELGDSYRQRLSVGRPGIDDRFGGFGRSTVKYGNQYDQWTDAWQSRNPGTQESPSAPIIGITFSTWDSRSTR